MKLFQSKTLLECIEREKFHRGLSTTLEILLFKTYQTLNILSRMLQDYYNVESSKSGHRSYLLRRGIYAQINNRKPILSNYNRLKSIVFEQKYQNWTKNDWRRVVWTDETSFSLTRTTGKEYHYIPTSDNRPLTYQTNQPEGGTFYNVLELLQK